MQQIRLVRAFLASPGGLEEERRAARDAAEEINTTVARPLGYRIELVGWEDTISGAGRPQAIINEELEVCEIFIGALWSRWGTPPSIDGPYSSGFEEEFELSFERWKTTGAPEMSMFFKDVSSQQMADPGTELQKVLAFRQRLIDEKQILFQPFASADEFAQKVRACLTKFITKSVGQERAIDLPETSSSVAITGPSSDSIAVTPGEEAVVLRTLFEQLAEPNNEDSLTASDVARLRLVSAALGGDFNDEGKIGVHDANLLYLHRSKTSFSIREFWTLAKVALKQFDNHVIPIWSWLRALEERVPNPLAVLSILGTESERVGALRVMALLQRPIAESGVYGRELLFKTLLQVATPDPVKVAALSLLRTIGTIDDLEVIEEEIERGVSQTATAAIEALLAIQLRENPETAAKTMIGQSFETISAKILTPVLEALNELSAIELRVALDHRSAAVRARALELLSLRRELPSDVTSRALSDPSAIVRLAAIRAVAATGSPLAPDQAAPTLKRPTRSGLLIGLAQNDAEGLRLLEEYRKEYIEALTDDLLFTYAEAPGRDAELARLELARRHFATYAPGLRADVDSEFADDLGDQWPVQAVAVNALSSLFAPSSPRDEKQKELIQGAIGILAEKGDEADLSRIRTALDRGKAFMTPSIISFFRSKGSWEDIPRIAKQRPLSGFGLGIDPYNKGLEALAVRAIHRISGTKLADLLKLDLPNRILPRIITTSSDKIFSSLNDADIQKLFQHPEDNVRSATAIKCIISLSKSRSISLMTEYQNQSSRFYNVIHWLDLVVAYHRDVARAAAKRAETEA